VTDHAIVPGVVLILVIVFMLVFSKPLSKALQRMTSMKGFGAEVEMQPEEVGEISKGAFDERDPPKTK
jgi:type II secretory pathway component PulM